MQFDIEKIDRTEKKKVKEFLGLPLELYGNTPLTRNTIRKTQGLLEAPYEYSLYLARKGGEVVGRMATYVNPGIKDPRGIPYGQIGLFESVQDYGVFSGMLDYAKGTFKGINDILFPFFLSTWHNYRFMAEQDFYFFFETPDKKYYLDFARGYGVKQTYRYVSFLSEGTGPTLEDTVRKYNRAVRDGFTFRDLDKTKFEEEMKIVYSLSLKSFADNHFYTDITYDEFRDMYLKSKRIIDSRMFTIAIYGNEPVGFSFAVPDFTPYFIRYDVTSLLSMFMWLFKRKGLKGLIYKTAAILPEYRNRGLVSAMIYRQAVFARKMGYENLIGALSYAENYSPRVLKGVNRNNFYELYVL
jgi:hypothetical protein